MQRTSYIRSAILDDFERIVEIENSCFSKKLAYNRRQLHYLLTKAHSTVLVETQVKKIHGFVIILYRNGTQVAGIETIDVDPVHRNKGVGSRLLSAALEDIKNRGMKKVRLEVATTNRAAIHLYKNSGFDIASLIKNYYLFNHGGSRDAFRMIKTL